MVFKGKQREKIHENSQDVFKDKAFHVMILELIKPYCSLQSRAFSSFLKRDRDLHITVDLNTVQNRAFRVLEKISKAKKDGLVPEQEELSELINSARLVWIEPQRMLIRGIKEPLLLNLNDLRQYQWLRPKALYFLTMNKDYYSCLLGELKKYKDHLISMGHSEMPEFLTVCMEILNSTEIDLIPDESYYDGDASIEEKLSNFLISEEELATASFEESEDLPEKTVRQSKGRKKKKKKKKTKSAALVHANIDGNVVGDDQSDEESDSYVEDEIHTGLDAQEDAEDAEHAAQNRWKPVELPTYSASSSTKINSAKADNTISKPQTSKASNHAHAKIRAPRKYTQPMANKESTRRKLAPWIEDLLTAHEFNFKNTMRTVYDELDALKLSPEFITRNEKFVLGFMSPLTNQPFAITEDIPHGAQLRKGQAAGWIKKIKYSLREHGVIPTGC